MNSEVIVIIVGFSIMYAWTLFMAWTDVRRISKENAKLRRELSDSLHMLTVYSAAKEGDMDTARIVAAAKRDMVRTKPPVSAGAKPKESTGIRITQGD